jgi:hypothetical protein
VERGEDSRIRSSSRGSLKLLLVRRKPWAEYTRQLQSINQSITRAVRVFVFVASFPSAAQARPNEVSTKFSERVR